MSGTCVLPHVGQDIKVMPPSLRSRALRIILAVITSSTGFPVKDTLIVSPIPSARSAPIPTADLIAPSRTVPASVTPTWSG